MFTILKTKLYKHIYISNNISAHKLPTRHKFLTFSLVSLLWAVVLPHLYCVQWCYHISTVGSGVTTSLLCAVVLPHLYRGHWCYHISALFGNKLLGLIM